MMGHLGKPALIVEREPGYHSRGHYHEGSKPHIDATKVWSLPIGTKLYTGEQVDELLRTALNRLEDLLKNDDPQARKEAQRFVDQVRGRA